MRGIGPPASRTPSGRSTDELHSVKLYFIIQVRRIPFMKLISLNTWGGKKYQPLIDFIKQQVNDTDIFCFQEMRNTNSRIKEFRGSRANLLSEIKSVLPNFQTFYFPVIKGFDDEANQANFDLTQGQAIFVKNSIKVTSKNNYFAYKKNCSQELKKDFSNLPTPLQYISFKLNNKEFAIFNFHGSPIPGNKLDTDKRLMEARKTKDLVDGQGCARILVGDFNLLPQTQSIRVYEQGMRNLIKEFNIEKTRSNLSPFYGTSKFQKFADYTFVSPDVNITNFQVPDVEISDHLPMILEFS